MRTVWRIVTHHYVSAAFSGEGARLYGGRWNRKGESVVYTAENKSLAMLEMLVQDEPLRAKYLLIAAQIPDDLSIGRIDVSDLPAEWRTLEGRDVLQAIGADWLRKAQSSVLVVPSVVVPSESNYLLNPSHPDFSRIQVGEPEWLETAVRLMRNLSGGRAQP